MNRDEIKKQKFRYYFYVAFMNLSMVSMAMNLYFKHIGFSFYQIGILFGILQIGKMIFEIPTGFLADRYGNRWSLLISLLMQMCGYVMMMCFHSFWAMAGTLALLAVSFTLMTGCATAIITNRLISEGLEDELIKLNAITRIIFYTCYGVGAFAVGFLIEIGYEVVFIISLISLSLAFLSIFFMSDDSAHKSKKKRIQSAEAVIYILHNPTIFYFSLIEAAIAWSMIPVDKFYNNYLHEYFGLSLPIVGIVISLQFISVSFFGLYSEKLGKRLPENWIVRLGPVAMILAFFLFSLISNPIISIAMYFLGLAFFCLYDPIHSKLFQLNISSDFRVTIISFKAILLALLSAFSQPLFGYVSDRFAMREAMMLLVLISFVMIVLINVLFYKLNFNQTESVE